MMIKNIGIFVLGAGVGGLVTWKLVQSYYESIVEDELESLKIMTERQLRRKEETECGDEYENVKRRFNVEENRAVEVEEDDDDDDDDFEFPEDSQPPSFDNYPVPYPISEQEFSEECLEYDKLSLKYYVDDETLCDDQEVPVEDVLALIGTETDDYLAAIVTNKSAKYDSVVYVRNESITVDFEITIVEGSYAAEVLGYETEKKKKKATSTKSKKVKKEIAENE